MLEWYLSIEKTQFFKFVDTVKLRLGKGSVLVSTRVIA